MVRRHASAPSLSAKRGFRCLRRTRHLHYAGFCAHPSGCGVLGPRFRWDDVGGRRPRATFPRHERSAARRDGFTDPRHGVMANFTPAFGPTLLDERMDSQPSLRTRREPGEAIHRPVQCSWVDCFAGNAGLAMTAAGDRTVFPARQRRGGAIRPHAQIPAGGLPRTACRSPRNDVDGSAVNHRT